MTPEEIHEVGMKLLSTKRADYTTASRYENFTRCAEVASWFERDIDKVFATLIAVKIARLASLLGRKEPNNESIADTFVDLVNYGSLWGGYSTQGITIEGLNQWMKDPNIKLQDGIHMKDMK